MQARPFIIALVAALIVTSSAPAFADIKSCLDGYEQGQRLRKQGKLLESRRTLQACMREDCPASVRKDCVGWFEDTSAEIPSISVKAIGADGCDRRDVSFTLDGATPPQGANGLLVDLDPGPHVLRADIDGKRVEQSIVVATRERGRIVTLLADPAVTTCGRVNAPQSSTAPSSSDAPRSSKEADSPRPVSSWSIVLAAAGVASLGVGAGFEISAWNKKSDLDDCRGACQQSDVDSMNRSFLIGDIGVGVGVAALVAAAIIHFTR